MINGRKASADGPIKTFPLRGIKDSPPYLHDDRLLTLDDTVEFFNLVLGLKLTAAGEEGPRRVHARAVADDDRGQRRPPYGGTPQCLDGMNDASNLLRRQPYTVARQQRATRSECSCRLICHSSLWRSSSFLRLSRSFLSLSFSGSAWVPPDGRRGSG